MTPGCRRPATPAARASTVPHRPACEDDDRAIGQRIDYLFASNDLGVRNWEIVLDLDALDNWLGTIPSDHNLVRATVTLPGTTGWVVAGALVGIS